MAISGPGPSEVAPPNSSGIKVIIVGLGMGGLAAAIECHRKGHTVSAFDKVDVKSFVQGDSLGISTNAARVISKWGGGSIHDILYNIPQVDTFPMYDPNGKFIQWADKTGYQKNDGYWALRSRLASTFFEHAETLGIDLRVGPDAAVARYWESHDEAGIETVGGDRFAADCVICCDGINSTGRQSILGEDSAVLLTSQYVFRTSFQTAELGNIPEIKWLMEGTTDAGKVFMGRGLEIGFASFANGQEMAMAGIYNVVDYAQEKLGRRPDNVHDLVGLMEGWGVQGKLRNMLKHVPNNKMVHHPLACRSPLSKWLSQGKRTIVIGDAAHPFLPVIGQGASQAIEDAAVVAISLELSGKNNVPLAFQIAEMIRKPRATTIQEASKTMHDLHYSQDWAAISEDPSLYKSYRPAWIFWHDCQLYAYQEYAKVREAIESGQEYLPRNIPQGGNLDLEPKFANLQEGPCYLDQACNKFRVE